VTDDRVWRPTAGSRIGLYLVAALFVALAAVIVATGDSDDSLLGGVAIGAVMGLLPAAVAVRFARRIRIVATDEELVIVSFASERRIPWSEVVDAEPGYSGITIGLSDGSSVLSGAVQKANISAWFRRDTRADQVAEYINRRAAATGRV
jgi:hypothetical protein